VRLLPARLVLLLREPLPGRLRAPELLRPLRGRGLRWVLGRGLPRAR